MSLPITIKLGAKGVRDNNKLSRTPKSPIYTLTKRNNTKDFKIYKTTDYDNILIAKI